MIASTGALIFCSRKLLSRFPRDTDWEVKLSHLLRSAESILDKRIRAFNAMGSTWRVVSHGNIATTIHVVNQEVSLMAVSHSEES